jgi:hypothetical protein
MVFLWRAARPLLAVGVVSRSMMPVAAIDLDPTDRGMCILVFSFWHLWLSNQSCVCICSHAYNVHPAHLH